MVTERRYKGYGYELTMFAAVLATIRRDGGDIDALTSLVTSFMCKFPEQTEETLREVGWMPFDKHLEP